jgi:hypothetical protein
MEFRNANTISAETTKGKRPPADLEQMGVLLNSAFVCFRIGAGIEVL